MSAEVQPADRVPLSYEKQGKTTHSEPAQEHDPFQVVLDDHELPRHLSLMRKWTAVFTVSTAALCVATASSVAAFTEDGVALTFNVGHEVTILTISFFIEGLGLGPLVMGPLSELYGRNLIYRASYTVYFALTWAVAFAPNIAVHLIFRFFTGFAGSAFLSVAGGSVSDLFSDATVANPMAFYTMCPFIGPVLGPLISGPIAASAMASNSAMRSSFAAAFPLFAAPMYHRLGTVGATALLAGLTTLMIPLPYAPVILLYERI
ncbi:hypothetical protein CVT24_010396 [Panaeolus cyanescens]|uniref:Major facilitator superfamily (MFS) profile domain-containing protein n=1 Tax=Panaeolus cyanescens TaxID=181874 RepID=A0A409W933_9AGAR|nr:hypothetical protein CVT24_010396 [Panaeolus cyanescens]